MRSIRTDTFETIIEKQIIFQCAPVIIGIKTANLLILSECQDSYVHKLFKDTELSLYTLSSYESKTYYLLYQPYKLEQYIHEKVNYQYLSALGYSIVESDLIIKEIAYKYNKYMQDRKEFPHEIGILLGYPLTDVISFISHNGTDYLYSGYWKVYDNLSETLAVFERYRRARKILSQFIANGGKLATVIKDIIRYE